MKRQKSFQRNKPALILVPTPIGNLQEMTPRALEILKEADCIAAEDTRNTKKLCMAYQIQTPLISHHEHNQATSIPQILERLHQGQMVAVVSDAGYPLVSDPGGRLVQAVIEEDIPVISVSGANAATNALVASGLSTEHYLFYGFLDAKSSHRIQALERLKDFPYTMIFYEAPHRIEAMLKDVLKCFGNRKMVLARELTKLHEEYIRGNVEEVLEVVPELKGEMVVLVEGATLKKESVDLNQAIQEVQALVDSGKKAKEAIKEISEKLSIKKNELYDAYHKQ